MPARTDQDRQDQLIIELPALSQTTTTVEQGLRSCDEFLVGDLCHPTEELRRLGEPPRRHEVRRWIVTRRDVAELLPLQVVDDVHLLSGSLSGRQYSAP